MINKLAICGCSFVSDFDTSDNKPTDLSNSDLWNHRLPIELGFTDYKVFGKPGSSMFRIFLQVEKAIEQNYNHILILLTSPHRINYFDEYGTIDSNNANSNEGGNGQWVRSKERYWLAIFGDPSSSNEPWGYRFGGHHIGLNVNIISNFISMHPLFFGANPAKVIEGPSKGYRALKPEEDLARKLVTSFSEDNRKIAVINELAPSDILTANYRDFNNTEFIKGLNFEKFTNNQRDNLIDLIKVYTSRFTEEYAENYLKQIIKQGFDNTIFAWAGSTEISKGHYYFIKHDKFLIEYDNTQNNANHIHSVLRDFDGDYGEDILSNHYKLSH